MGDHFVLLVNRMFTDSRMDDDAVECRDSLEEVVPPFVIGGELGGDCSSHKIDFGGDFSPRELVECRICQDEDFDSNMEAPCSCRGSMKYAHRKCVQRWCNEKGDTLCEICHQEFKPGYTVSQALFQFGAIPMNFRGNWEISRRRFGDPSLVAMVSTDRNFHAPEDDYEHAVTASRRWICCRSLAVIFMLLLVTRHSLPVITRASPYSVPLLSLLLLRTVGIVFPIYVMLRVIRAVQHRRHQRHLAMNSSSDEDTVQQPIMQHQADVIHVR